MPTPVGCATFYGGITEGKDGKDGTDGTDGKDGTDGTDGKEDEEEEEEEEKKREEKIENRKKRKSSEGGDIMGSSPGVVVGGVVGGAVSGWNVFKFQAAAFKCADENGALPVFAMEISKEGKRKFIATSYPEFWKRYKATSGNRKVYYEVI